MPHTDTELNQESGWRTRALLANELVPLSVSSVPGMGSLSFSSKTGSSFIWLDNHLNYKLIMLWTSSLLAFKLPLKITVGQGEKCGALTLGCQRPVTSKLGRALSAFTAPIYHRCKAVQSPQQRNTLLLLVQWERNNPTLLLLPAGCTRKVRQGLPEAELPYSHPGWVGGSSGGCPGSRQDRGQ